MVGHPVQTFAPLMVVVLPRETVLMVVRNLCRGTVGVLELAALANYDEEVDLYLCFGGKTPDEVRLNAKPIYGKNGGWLLT